MTIASWTALGVVTAGLVAYAVTADGYPVHRAELNDGGIWVTNQSMGALGRQNVPVAQIDARVYDGSDEAVLPELDVLQDGSAVLSVDRAAQTLMPIDVQMAAGLEEQKVRASGDPLWGGGSLGVLDGASGKLWATTADDETGQVTLAAVSGTAKPLARIGGDAVGAAGTDGTLYAASSEEGDLVTLRRTAGSTGFDKPVTTAIGPAHEGKLAAMTVVGDVPVLLDSKGNLLTASDSLGNVGRGATLQQAGPAADEVLVATSGKLIAVAVASGEQREVAEVRGSASTIAAPVALPNGCAFAAWGSGTRGTLVSACGATEADVREFEIKEDAELVFRKNRNQIVLNDQHSGMTWTVTTSKPNEISNWEAFRQQVAQPDDQDAQNSDQKVTQPPVANPDVLGARSGRTTTLNVLDNDLIASDGILSVIAVKGMNRDDVTVRVAPDRQTLLATVAAGASGTASFRYTIDDGTQKKTSQADGDVTLNLRNDDPASGKPQLRPNATPQVFPVAAGGVLEVAVTPDWRDPTYGDPIVVDTVTPGGNARVSTTALGLLRAEVPVGTAGGLQTVSYEVTTGGERSAGTVQLDVVPAGTETRPAKAEPDVVAGEEGGPIQVRPLDNDIAGADGSDAGARLQLAGPVAPTGGLDVRTDIESGRVTITGVPGTYVLDYSAGFGAAARATGKIRVDISAKTPEGDLPVATPDLTAVHGVSPVTVDVLANDFDPRGRMLVVQHAAPSDPESQLEVAVIDGRWVRVNAIDGNMTPKSQSVTYTISNGTATAQGSINVTQRDALTGAANAPVTQADRITVRAGDTAAAPVLDNDATPSGDPVGLVLDETSETLGELRVLPAGGTAYVSGRQVRFVAPATVEGPTDVEVQYVVENTGDPTAATAIGTLKVHITPAPSSTNPNQVPTPRALEGRVVQGDLVTIKLPPVGSDPDGDSVAVSGVATAPQLGRVLQYGANSLTYQAYPDAQGTDEFTYEVTDPFGKKATGTVRVGVVTAGEPQAPVAINDVWYADPDRTVDVDVIGNDLRTPGTKVRVLPLDDKGSDVKLQSDQGPVSVHAPKDTTTRNVTYTITNGLAESRGVVTIVGKDGFNNPPITKDLFASPKTGAGTVEVDVLAAVFDVDGPEDKLQLEEVTGFVPTEDAKSVQVKGGTAVIPVKDVAQVLAYRVVDDQGAAAAAAIYVPARPRGAPYLKPGAEIRMSPSSTKTVDLSELVDDPEGDKVILTTVDGISASPTDRLAVVADSATALTVTSTASEGPGSIVFEVADRAKLTDPDVSTAYISVPVQVGEQKPVINCPTMPIDVPEGGVSTAIDIASVCHVWTADPAKARDLDFTAKWNQEINGVDVESDGASVQLVAGGDARRGDTGVVGIGARGHDATGELLVRVVALPDPKLAAMRLDTEAGQPVSVDTLQYLSTPMPARSRKVKVMEVIPLNGASAAHKVDGSTITFSPKPDTDGLMGYRVEVSDVGGSTSSARPRAVGEVTVAVVARPDAPTGLAAGQEMLANTVALTWQTPDNNGKRIDSYEVEYSGPSSGTFSCPGSPCRVTGLKNGNPYTFKVRAHNETQQNGGWSEWSNDAQATPDALTGPPLNPQVVLQRDQALTVSWAPPAPCDCSEVQKYRIAWPGGVKDVGATERQTTVPAANGDVITVKITALNLKGVQTNTGPSTSVAGTGAGKPATPGAPTLAPTNRPGNAAKAIGISWAPVGANGPGPASYQVQRTGGAGTRVVCAWTTATSCADEVTNDGTVYTYQVQAKNAEADSPRETDVAGKALHVSAYGAGRAIEASAPPNAPQIASVTPTGADRAVQITFTVGASHGIANNVSCTYNGGTACGGWSSTFATGGEASQTRTIQVGANGSASNITLRACNGGTANLCTSSNTVGAVPYGPIGNVSINATPDNPAQGDRTTNWSISVNPNGAPVHWEVRRSGSVVAQGNSGNGAFTQSGGETLAYDTTYTYNLVVTDASGHGRAGKNASDTARTGTNPPPPLSVTVSKGTSCSYSGCTGAIVPCNGTCWYIKITTSGFSGGVGCTYRSASDGSQIGSSTWTQGGNETRESWWWAGDPNSFYIQCVNGSESDRSPNAW